MQRLHIPPDKDAPEVIFDPQTGNFSVQGISHPENIASFFRPAMQWLDEYLGEVKTSGAGSVKPIRFRFFFRYINSASYKYLVIILQKMSEFLKAGVPVNVEWLYEPEDEDMRDSGLELLEHSNIKIPYTCGVSLEPL